MGMELGGIVDPTIASFNCLYAFNPPIAAM
jgi:hypothetical protein